jgi:hypothetical protein
MPGQLHRAGVSIAVVRRLVRLHLERAEGAAGAAAEVVRLSNGGRALGESGEGDGDRQEQDSACPVSTQGNTSRDVGYFYITRPRRSPIKETR